MLVYGKPIKHNGVYEMKLLNGQLQGYHETDREKKTEIQYDDDKDVKMKIKKKQVVFEFLYNYNQTDDRCCVVSFEYDLLLGVAMTVIIY
jgi:hypothetical protein